MISLAPSLGIDFLKRFGDAVGCLGPEASSRVFEPQPSMHRIL
jgi:hypothetical protein